MCFAVVIKCVLMAANTCPSLRGFFCVMGSVSPVRQSIVLEAQGEGIMVRELDSGPDGLWPLSPTANCCWCLETGTSLVCVWGATQTHGCGLCRWSTVIVKFEIVFPTGKISTSSSTSFSPPSAPRTQLMSSSIVLRMADFSIYQVCVDKHIHTTDFLQSACSFIKNKST